MDSTLIDHFETIPQSYNNTFKDLGLSQLSLETIKATIGSSLPVFMEIVNHANKPIAVFEDLYDLGSKLFDFELPQKPAIMIENYFDTKK